MKLEVKNLCVFSGTHALVKDVNLSIKTGQISALVGKSGSGKTLSALALQGFTPPNLTSKMQLFLDGKNLSGDDLGALNLSPNSSVCGLSTPLDNKNLNGANLDLTTPNLTASNSGILNLNNSKFAASNLNDKKFKAVNLPPQPRLFASIMQNPKTAFNPLMSIKAHALETLKASGKFDKFAMQKIYAVLADVGLKSDVLGLYPHEMSGGMLQRAMIALALLSGAKFIVADEPTTDLDLAVQAKILELLKRLVRKNDVGVLLITHDFGVVANLASEVAVMSEGEIVESAVTKELFALPKTTVAKELIAAHLGLYRGQNSVQNLSVFDATDSVNLAYKLVCNGEAFNGFEDVNLRAKIKFKEQPSKHGANQILNNEAALLSVRNLSHAFKTFSFFGKSSQKLVLKDINFDIKRGEALGLLGRSGCGKSTLAKAIMGLLKPSSGEIWLDGERVNLTNLAKKREFYSQAQIVFQDSPGSINPRFSVREAIEEPLLYLSKFSASQRLERVKELLAILEIDEALDKRAALLSGGQLSRVMIARALAVRPRLVIMDEALSSLDAPLQSGVLRHLLRLKGESAFLFITHDVRLARMFCERVILMDEGRVVESARVDEGFKSEVGKELERSVLAAMPI